MVVVLGNDFIQAEMVGLPPRLKEVSLLSINGRLETLLLCFRLFVFLVLGETDETIRWTVDFQRPRAIAGAVLCRPLASQGETR